MGQRQGEAIAWHRSGSDFQRIRILYYRLSEQLLQRSCEKGRARRAAIKARERVPAARPRPRLAPGKSRNHRQKRSRLRDHHIYICPDCQHENEPERIYCHSCGARLDRSKLSAAAVPLGEPDVKTRQHLEKLMRGGNANVKGAALKLAKVVLGAIGLAALIVMASPLDQPPATKSYDFAPMINMDMVSATSNHQGVSLVYNEEQVNSYIASNLRRKDSPCQSGLLPAQTRYGSIRRGTVQRLAPSASYWGTRFIAAALIG